MRPGGLRHVKDEITIRRNAGETLQEIADRYGASREAIRLVCLGAGLAPRHIGWEQAEVKRLARAVVAAARAQIRAERYPGRNGYNQGCRCETCKVAARAYMRGLKGKPAPTHGYSGYTNYACRCSVCKQGHADYERARRRRKDLA